MKRRKFVKHMGLLIPATFIGENLFKGIKAQQNKLMGGSVIIVGAGASGLYAAKILKEAGVIVTILEASAVHGGRIRPLDGFADFTVELGAAEVHGKGNQNGNPPSFLYSTIHDYNPDLLVDEPTKELIELDNGYVIDPPYWDSDLQAALDFYNNLYAYTGDDVIMNDYLADTYGIVEGDKTWHIYEAWIGAEWGSSIKRYGMKSMEVSENLWLTGNKNYYLDDSYLNILDTLFFNTVLGDIIYNKQVTKVDYSGAGVNVTCADGSQFPADHIIITSSVAVLRSGEIAFTPELPIEKTDAINTIGMGAGMKIILKFNEIFWPEDVFYMTFKGYITEAWPSGMLKTGATNNVLTCFIMGERAEYLSSLGNDAITTVLSELDGLFNGAATQNYSDGYIIDWLKEPFVKGAYSFPAPGTYISETDNTRITLAENIDCKVFFAGEATSLNHPATVHGALESGERAANEVLNCIATSNNPIAVSQQNQFDFSVIGEKIFVTVFSDVNNTLLLTIYSITGDLIKTYEEIKLYKGENKIEFNLNNISNGIYIARVVAGNNFFEKKFTVL